MKGVKMKLNFRCLLHGSFRKHFEEIKEAHRIFTAAGIEVLAPAMSEIKAVSDGFAMLASDKETDKRMIELLYLCNLKRLGENGFSYFVNSEGYIGKTVSYELGVAQISNVPCFFMEKPRDLPVYVHKNAVWKPEHLAEYILAANQLPGIRVRRRETAIHRLWEELMVPGSVVAVGGIIEYAPLRWKGEREILLVKTHKWGGRYSIVGGRVRRNERLDEALAREIREETGLKAFVGAHICTFDQIKNSGYYVSGVQHIFVDKVVAVGSRKARLNDEAEEFIWALPRAALAELPIEPNARHTLELYANTSGAI